MAKLFLVKKSNINRSDRAFPELVAGLDADDLCHIPTCAQDPLPLPGSGHFFLGLRQAEMGNKHKTGTQPDCDKFHNFFNRRIATILYACTETGKTEAPCAIALPAGFYGKGSSA